MNDPLLALLAATLEDARLQDDERCDLADALRAASPTPETLNAVRNHAFALARERAGSADAATLLRWLEGVMRAIDSARGRPVAVRTRASFSPGTDCLHTIVSHLRGARRSADLCVFTLSDDRITTEVLQAHRRGVALRIVSDNAKAHDAGSDIDRLRAAGVPVALDRSDAHMHHKFALFDGEWLLNGSYNWTRSACEHNQENLVASNDPVLVGAFGGVFERLWGEWGKEGAGPSPAPS